MLAVLLFVPLLFVLLLFVLLLATIEFCFAIVLMFARAVLLRVRALLPLLRVAGAAWQLDGDATAAAAKRQRSRGLRIRRHHPKLGRHCVCWW